MKRHEDPLFETYREAFAQYEAPAPAGTLAAVHKKMNKVGFWYFSWTSLNVYTLSALIAAGLAFSLFAKEGESSALSFTPKTTHLSLAAMEKTQKHLSFNVEENVDEDDLDFNLLRQSGASKVNSPANGLANKTKANTISTNSSKKKARGLAVNLAQVQVRHEVILEKDLQRDQALNFANAIDELATSSTEVPSVENAQGILDQAKRGTKETGITLKSKQKVK